MEFLQYPLALIVTIGVLVTVHEFGHFLIARRSGVHVLRFSVGFGPSLFSWKDRRGTEFVVAAIPLGGYVRMRGELEVGIESKVLVDEAISYEQLPVGWRIAIAFGGPAANFLLAILIYWILFILGSTNFAPVTGPMLPNSVAATAGLQPYDEILAVDGKMTQDWQQVSMALAARAGDSGNIQLTASKPGSEVLRELDISVENWLANEDEPNFIRMLGIAPIIPPIIGNIIVESAAEEAGLKQWDRVLRIDTNPVYYWSDWVKVVRENPNRSLNILVERGGSEIELTLVPRSSLAEGEEIGFVGVEAHVNRVKYGIIGATFRSIEETWSKTFLTLSLVKKMVVGDLSTKTLSGPVAIAKVAADSASFGWRSFIGLLALLSISLGVLNLLPIPVLDGGHIIYCLAEMIRGRPLSERMQLIGNQFGMLLVGGLMIFVIYNDLARLI